MTDRLNIGVLVSGSGSNLQAIMDGCTNDTIPGRVTVVVSNKDGVFALERARNAGLPAVVINHDRYGGREYFEKALAEVLEQHGVQLICLAGFMRILSPWFIRYFSGRILNIHPALLPAFPGLHVQKRALEMGVRFSGATVHFVDDGVDTGPIVIQAVVPILPDDDVDTLSARILVQEHRIYPLAVRWFAQKRLRLVNGKVQLDAGLEHEREMTLAADKAWIHPPAS
ncbi:MAG: phosphoribosylglycinamide formyltransferase [Magnetococcales bacterium]|nr:phosphoribosylglycinamide formyltransferase [Magnetococcales bacterium]MBF0150622.1 phosphoribosylglycinamide formyltransferase [Magnetococcales bacterium]MBF0174548.1 phosphoribosylglycinamide formyltransferase [Magnetococcales bacterium]MBF0629362.1 phosphoribosylglycinamide formyltransferase [Magnetococcales bacterium]